MGEVIDSIRKLQSSYRAASPAVKAMFILWLVGWLLIVTAIVVSFGLSGVLFLTGAVIVITSKEETP